MPFSQDTKLHADLVSFCRQLPKIELHAHLSGSVSRETLREIWIAGHFDLEDPSTALAPDKKKEFNLKTAFPFFNNYIRVLINCLENVKLATQRVLEDFERDGVVYLELRTTPRAFPANGTTKRDYVETVVSTIERFNAKSSRMKAYLILSVDREGTAEAADECVDLAVDYMSRSVVGLDLCGDPRNGDVRIFCKAITRARENGLYTTLHFAEIASPPITDELQILLDLQPNRIGHVIHTPPEICEEIIRQGLPLELCLSCNMLAKLLPNHNDQTTAADHHFGYWRDKGLPLVLCTDDKTLFMSDVSDEYILAAIHFDLTYEDIWKLAYTAIDSIFATADSKEKQRVVLNEWKASEGQNWFR